MEEEVFLLRIVTVNNLRMKNKLKMRVVQNVIKKGGKR